jgi:cupin fold WbuC family metalloprotein
MNFHAELSHPAQRLLNAVEPGSYIRPHRHSHADRDETFVVVRGSLGLVIFDESGRVTQSVVLRPDGDVVGGHVPSGTFHTLVSLESGSIFFESKAGPYEALDDKDFGPWSPPEGHPDVPSYLAKLQAHF